MHAMLHSRLHTTFGWQIRVGTESNPRSLANFPVQANGAEMLRLACSLATEAGVTVCAPVHDAVLIEGPASQIETVVEQARQAMAEASRIVLDGFEIRTDVVTVRAPDRYMDERGKHMWETVNQILNDISADTIKEQRSTLPKAGNLSSNVRATQCPSSIKKKSQRPCPPNPSPVATRGKPVVPASSSRARSR